MRQKALAALIASLRAEGVCRYRRKTAREEIELELFQQQRPAPAVEAPRRERTTDAMRREAAAAAVPEGLRRVISPEAFEDAKARAARFHGEES